MDRPGGTVLVIRKVVGAGPAIERRSVIPLRVHRGDRPMGSVIDIVFDRDMTDYEPEDRYSLACVYFEPEFEELAKRLGVTPLTEFYSDDPESLDDEFDEGFFDDPK